MNNREFLAATLRSEIPLFKKVIEAVPADKLEYRPHERQKSALEMLLLFGGEPKMILEIAEKGGIEMTSFRPDVVASTPAEASASVERDLNELVRIVEGTSEEEWESPMKMRMGDKVVWEQPRDVAVWTLILDLVHHRGQLSTYLRPMGGKVPSIYGPSGDEPIA